MSSSDTARVHYFPRQYLRRNDFEDEQAYHLAMRRRHLIAQHSWGIVRGLELQVDEGSLFVLPGVAVDGYGRELILEEKQPLPLNAFAAKGSNILDVWLSYNRLGVEQPPRGYTGCEPGESTDFYRWREAPLLRLEAPDLEFPNPRQPKSVPQGDLDFNPSRTPPDEPEQDWPVFLGQITSNPADPSKPYTIDQANRPYVGLKGEVLVAPSGAARVQLARESENWPAGFAVFIPAPSSEPGGALPEELRLSIDPDSKTTIHGDLKLHGDLTVAQGAIELGEGPDSQEPWLIYHHREVEDVPKNELRVVMKGGSQGSNSVVIGHWDAEGNEFVPCLTIYNNCDVRVHGNLVVRGSIEGREAIRKKKMLTPTLSAEAKRFVLSALMSGISGASTLLNQFYGSFLGMKITPQPSVQVMASCLKGMTSDEIDGLAKMLKANHSDLAQKLGNAFKDKVE